MFLVILYKNMKHANEIKQLQILFHDFFLIVK